MTVTTASATSLSALHAEIAQLRAEKEALRNTRTLEVKVSAKGAISIYGLNTKFPVTLYRDQLIAVLDKADDLRAWIDRHDEQLKRKTSGNGHITPTGREVL